MVFSPETLPGSARYPNQKAVWMTYSNSEHRVKHWIQFFRLSSDSSSSSIHQYRLNQAKARVLTPRPTNGQANEEEQVIHTVPRGHDHLGLLPSILHRTPFVVGLQRTTHASWFRLRHKERSATGSRWLLLAGGRSSPGATRIAFGPSSLLVFLRWGRISGSPDIVGVRACQRISL